MANAVAAMPTGKVARKLAFTFVGVLLFAAGLTYLFLGMRAVMDIGGSCASGGPYQVARPCPDGAGLIFLGIFAGLMGVGLTIAGAFPGGPQLWTLAWPALFCSLGWNFLEYGVDPPAPEQGPVWGWLVCAVVFLLMGGLPLIGVLIGARSILWGRSDRPTTPRETVAQVRTKVQPRARTSRTQGAPPPARSASTPFGSTTVPSSADPAPAAPFTTPSPPTATASAAPVPPGTPTVVVFDGPSGQSLTADDYADAAGIVRDLERLSTLHREGALTDDEFARAKAARLAEEQEST